MAQSFSDMPVLRPCRNAFVRVTSNIWSLWLEGSRSLDVMKLARAGYLSGATAGSWQWTYRDATTASIVITGARDAVTERTGAMVVDESVHDLNEQSEREVRARLGPDRWARAYAAGRSASIDSLMRDIDTARRSRARDVDEAATRR